MTPEPRALPTQPQSPSRSRSPRVVEKTRTSKGRWRPSLPNRPRPPPRSEGQANSRFEPRHAISRLTLDLLVEHCAVLEKIRMLAGEDLIPRTGYLNGHNGLEP